MEGEVSMPNSSSDLDRKPGRNLGLARVVHMASLARSGETLMLRTLGAHSRIHIAAQLIDSPESEKRLRFFMDWPDQTIPCHHEILSGLDVRDGDLILVKQGIWEHRWPFNGFVLARNPVSVYASLLAYDDQKTARWESLLLRLGCFERARALGGNIERLTRWFGNIDPCIAVSLPHMDLLEIFAAFYNRRMGRLATLDLPVIHYEDFILQPAAMLEELCGKLGIEYEDGMVDSHKLHSGMGHGKNPLDRPIGPSSDDKSRRVSRRDRERIIALTAEAWQRLGYSLAEDRLGFRTITP